MTDPGLYIEPLQKGDDLKAISGTGSIGERMVIYSGKESELQNLQIAFIGVNEGRMSNENEGCALGAEAIRKSLYPLHLHSENVFMIDMGNIRPGHSLEDTHFALEMTSAYLIERNIVPIIIGGPDHCTLPLYRAFCRLERMTNILSVDPIFDIGDVDEETHSSNYLSKLIIHKPGFLFDYTNIGHQSYLVNAEMTKVMKRMLFQTMRLGEVNESISDTEPLVRNADLMCLDVRSVRMSDSPGHAHPLPNGLYAEQFCQLASYAGTNEKLACIAFFEYNPSYDDRAQSSQLIAQAVWCFLDGYSRRHKEDVLIDTERFIRYLVHTKENHDLVFYKSKITERWWLEVPYPPRDGNRFKKSHVLPCSYSDYLAACDHEIPDIWLQTYQKLS